MVTLQCLLRYCRILLRMFLNNIKSFFSSLSGFISHLDSCFTRIERLLKDNLNVLLKNVVGLWEIH